MMPVFWISIHAPRGGSDLSAAQGDDQHGHISIHAPRGGSDVETAERVLLPPAISIHAPRGGSDDHQLGAFAGCGISIHAPRGGSDQAPARRWACLPNFNPRSPWGERLGEIDWTDYNTANFNPRSPWGERPDVMCNCPFPMGISIHAPRGGSDVIKLLIYLQ